jgi:SAM-dependent methyltransferase
LTKSSLDKNGSPDRFGYEWGNYGSLEELYEEQFLRWIPFLRPHHWPSQTFLDVGCGMGRNSYWPLKYGAKAGVGVDIDDRTLASARSTLAVFPNFSAYFKSAYDLGYENQFDIAFSIGVIHHLEDPDLAISNMVRATKPGGRVIIWVYGHENNEWIVKYFNPFRNTLFSKMPISLVHHLSLYPSIFLYYFLRSRNFKSRYLNLLKKFKFTHLRSIVFDQMLPVIANYWTYDEVYALMRNAGLQNIEVQNVNDMSWSAVGYKQS